MTTDERNAKYRELLSRKSDSEGRLDLDLMEICLWFAESGLVEDDLRALSLLYPKGHRNHRSLATLKERLEMGQKIPRGRWNPELSYSVHKEAAKIQDREARWDVIANPPQIPVVTWK